MRAMNGPSNERRRREPFQLQTVQDLIALLEEEIQAVRSDPEAGPLQKARTIDRLARIALRAVESKELTARVEALETILKKRKKNPDQEERQ